MRSEAIRLKEKYEKKPPCDGESDEDCGNANDYYDDEGVEGPSSEYQVV